MPRTRFVAVLSLLAIVVQCAALSAAPANQPFSLTIDGDATGKRLQKIASAGADAQWRDRQSGVVARLERVEQKDFSAVEWTLHLTNTGKTRSPMLSDIWAGDFEVPVDSKQPAEVFTTRGSTDLSNDFEPLPRVLENNKPITLESFGGRSSDGTMPYFNIYGGRQGAMVAVGWTGNWRTDITSITPGKIRVQIGLQRAHFMLEPGETVRLPAVLVMPWTGERQASFNKFRRLMLAHYTPQHYGPMELTPVAASPHYMVGFNDTTEANLLKIVQQVSDAKLGIDTFWLDAGWNEGGFPEKQGNPEPAPSRFPNGLKPVADLSHKLGMRYLQWFEIERVMAGTTLDQEHPEWMLKSSDSPERIKYQENDGFRLFDLGNPDAYKWALDYLTRHIKDTGIDIYRQDSNLYPSFFWHTNEPGDRVGIREIRHIENMYALLDTLQQRFPKMIIDNCASGGRRLDFEMMRRSVPYFRSDYLWGRPEYPRSGMAMNWGVSYWVPLTAFGTISSEIADVAGGIGAPFPIAINYADQKVVDAMRPRVEQIKRVRPFFVEDYYPLTPYSLDPAKTIALQYHNPKTNAGLVMAFGTDIDLSKIHPQAMTANAYTWSDWSVPGATEQVTRKDLDRTGLPLVKDAATKRNVLMMEYQAVAN